MSNNAASNVIPMRDFDRPAAESPGSAVRAPAQGMPEARAGSPVALRLRDAGQGRGSALGARRPDPRSRAARSLHHRQGQGARRSASPSKSNIAKTISPSSSAAPGAIVKRDEFSQFDLSSLELGLVNDEDLEETLKVNDMAAKLRRYCEEELNALDQRIGVLIGDANLQGDGNPFSPQAMCNAYKQTCRKLESNMKIRMIFHKLFDDHVLDDVRSIYKDLNALLSSARSCPRSALASAARAGAIGRRPGVTPAAGLPMPAADCRPGRRRHAGRRQSDGGNGYADGNARRGCSGMRATAARRGGGEQDLFAVLQALLARNAHATPMRAVAGVAGIPGGCGRRCSRALASYRSQAFPPIMTAGAGGGTSARVWRGSTGRRIGRRFRV